MSETSYPVEIKSRVQERLAWGLETSCRLVSPKEQNWSALVRDLSRGGVGLVLDSYLEAGSELAIEIPRTTDVQAKHLHVRVVHATALPGGRWLLGCSLVKPLSEAEMHTLLAQTEQS